MSLKTGGICIFTTRTEYLTKYSYGEAMEKLTSDGKWKEVKKAAHFKYDKAEDLQGVGRFAKTEVMVFAYEKL